MTDRCQLVSADLDEPLAGTAAHARAWLLVEDLGPWGAKALRECTIDAEVANDLEARADAAGVRVQLIRRADRRCDVPGGRVAFLVHSGPGVPWAVRLVLDEDDLTTLDPALATRPIAPMVGEPVEGDLHLVCTHAKRDACCAKFGRPVVDAIAGKAPEQTWETSHTGGHRFAGVLLVLPDGLTFGRLEAPGALAVLEDLRAGRLPTGNYRGRSVDTGPGQAAEVAVRLETGLDGRDAVRVLASVPDVGAHVVHLDAEGQRWRAIVASRPMGTLRPVSCGGTPEDRDLHEVTGLAPVTDASVGQARRPQ